MTSSKKRYGLLHFFQVSSYTNIPKCELAPTQSIVCQRQVRLICLSEQAYHKFLITMFALELTSAGVFDNDACFCQTILALTFAALCSLYTSKLLEQVVEIFI